MLNVITGQLAGGVPVSTNSYESIQTVTVGLLGQSAISFTSIPSTYKHLQIRAIARSTYAADIVDTYLTLNSDTGTNYRTHQLRGNGASATAADLGAAAAAATFVNVGSTATASVFSGAVIDILDYTNTNKYTTIRSLNGADTNGAGNVFFRSSLWLNTAAITTITITAEATSNHAQYSSFALYGIKG